MPLFQQGLTDKDYQEFKDEISDILDYAFNTHKLPMVRAWVPCVLSRTCEDGQLGLHGNFVSVLDVQYTKYLFISFQLNRALPLVHLERGEGIVGKAFMTDQAFFSPNIAFSSNPKDPLYHDSRMFGLHDAAIAVPLRSSIHNSECVLEFLLPSNCADLEERKKLVTALFSTLEQCCKTLRVVADKVLKEQSNSPFLAFKPLQPFDVAEQSFVNDWSCQKKNPREATPKRVIQLLPESSDQNEKRPDPTPRIEPAEMFDAIGLGSLAASETSEERHATGEKTVNVHISLNDSTKSTGGKSTGGAGSKRDWAWKYCSSIPGNNNGVICSFCDLEMKGGGITRFKSHISGCDSSKNVKKCENVPPEIKAEIEQKGKKKITKEND